MNRHSPDLQQRRRAELRFKAYGLAAITFAVGMLVLLLTMIGIKAAGAFSHHNLQIEVEWVDPANGDAVGQAASIAAMVSDLNAIVRADLETTFPAATEDRRALVELHDMVSRLALLPVANRLFADPPAPGSMVTFDVALSDDIDLLLKGAPKVRRVAWSGGVDRLTPTTGGRVELARASGGFVSLQRDLQQGTGTLLLQLGGVVIRAVTITDGILLADVLAGEISGVDAQDRSRMTVHWVPTPELQRNVSDQQIAWTLLLQEAGRVERTFNTAFFSNADSTYPELAGILAAFMGSVFIMLVTAAVAVPIGIAAALYLEEFAPQNRLTRLIEVNINNLAAVPSIVFGLLGAAVLINFLNMPRSAPLVGGLVLGLMTLPTIILAARAALRAVPETVRNAALGLGASKSRAVFDHVLPLAAPGILTGAIIGLSRALGETAPLLLIGMVAFVAEAPGSPSDEATALPVLIYKWSTGAERAWEPATAGAIVILLGFMVLMNAAAVLFRRRFDRTRL